MDKERKSAYFAGTFFTLIFIILALIAVQNELNLSGLIFWVFTLFFGGLGFGSFLKPDLVGSIASKILKMLLGSDNDKSDSHDTHLQDQLQQNSSGSIQAGSIHGNVNFNVNMKEKVNSKDLEVYSPIHAMILKINSEVSRELALQATVGIWVNASLIDHTKISEIFNQHGDKFRDKDLAMWFKIEKEIKTGNGFYLDKDRQEWFDYLEAEYKRRKNG